MMKYGVLLLWFLLGFSCSESDKNKPIDENTKNITMWIIMKYDFREAIDLYGVPKYLGKYDNTDAELSESIKKNTPKGKKVKVLGVFWINKTGNKEIEVWYAENEDGLWMPFNAEERKISKHFLEN